MDVKERKLLASVIERLQAAKTKAHSDMMDARIEKLSTANFYEGKVIAFNEAIKLIGELDKEVV